MHVLLHRKHVYIYIYIQHIDVYQNSSQGLFANPLLASPSHWHGQAWPVVVRKGLKKPRGRVSMSLPQTYQDTFCIQRSHGA